MIAAVKFWQSVQIQKMACKKNFQNSLELEVTPTVTRSQTVKAQHSNHSNRNKMYSPVKLQSTSTTFGRDDWELVLAFSAGPENPLATLHQNRNLLNEDILARPKMFECFSIHHDNHDIPIKQFIVENRKRKEVLASRDHLDEPNKRQKIEPMIGENRTEQAEMKKLLLATENNSINEKVARDQKIASRESISKLAKSRNTALDEIMHMVQEEKKQVTKSSRIDFSSDSGNGKFYLQPQRNKKEEKLSKKLEEGSHRVWSGKHGGFFESVRSQIAKHLSKLKKNNAKSYKKI